MAMNGPLSRRWEPHRRLVSLRLLPPTRTSGNPAASRPLRPTWSVSLPDRNGRTGLRRLGRGGRIVHSGVT